MSCVVSHVLINLKDLGSLFIYHGYSQLFAVMFHLSCVSASHRSMCSLVFEGLAPVHYLAAIPAGMCVCVESATGLKWLCRTHLGLNHSTDGNNHSSITCFIQESATGLYGYVTLVLVKNNRPDGKRQ